MESSPGLRYPRPTHRPSPLRDAAHSLRDEPELPDAVQAHLPAHAHDIFNAAFNAAWAAYGQRNPWQREEIAYRVAWAAVKRRYHKVGQEWVPLNRTVCD